MQAHSLFAEKTQLHHNNIAMTLQRALINRLRLGHYHFGNDKAYDGDTA